MITNQNNQLWAMIAFLIFLLNKLYTISSAIISFFITNHEMPLLLYRISDGYHLLLAQFTRDAAVFVIKNSTTWFWHKKRGICSCIKKKKHRIGFVTTWKLYLFWCNRNVLVFAITFSDTNVVNCTSPIADGTSQHSTNLLQSVSSRCIVSATEHCKPGSLPHFYARSTYFNAVRTYNLHILYFSRCPTAQKAVTLFFSFFFF